MCDSQPVLNHVTRVFTARNEHMAMNQRLIDCIIRGISTICFHHIPRKENRETDALSGLTFAEKQWLVYWDIGSTENLGLFALYLLPHIELMLLSMCVY